MNKHIGNDSIDRQTSVPCAVGSVAQSTVISTMRAEAAAQDLAGSLRELRQIFENCPKALAELEARLCSDLTFLTLLCSAIRERRIRQEAEAMMESV